MSKLTSGILAVGIYLALIFLILLYYNVHSKKAKHYVEKNENRVTVTLINSDKTVFNKSSKITLPKKPVVAQQHHAISKPIPTPKKHIIPRKSDVKQLRRLQEARRARAKAKKLRERKRLERLAKIKAQKEKRERARQARIKAERAKKERERQARIKAEQAKKERERQARIKAERAKKERERQVRIKAEREKKERERQARIKAERAKKERERQARIKAEQAKKERERQARIKAEQAKKERERQARIKAEREKKERERQARIRAERKKKERERLARIKAEEEQKRRRRERSRNLFSSINTNNRPKKEPIRSRVRHTSRAVDRIKNTHQSGRVSSRNRDKGVVNAYIARVQRQLNNWNAQSNYKGQSATIRLTISSSGHFRYRVRRSSSVALSNGLKRFLKQLNRVGLGQHRKSKPYIIEVTFSAR